MTEIPEKDGRPSLINRSNLRDLTVAFSLVSAAFYEADTPQICVSFLLLSFGCFFHLVTKGVLIRNVVLCREGMYSMVRHPYYMANYLIDSGFCLLSGNEILLLLYPFLFYWAYGTTIRREEAFLGARYGRDFYKYALVVPQIFPDSHSIKTSWKAIVNGYSTTRVTRNEVARFMRFWAIGFSIVLVHNLTNASFAKDIPLPVMRTWWEMIPPSLAATLTILSLILRRRKGVKSVKTVKPSGLTLFP